MAVSSHGMASTYYLHQITFYFSWRTRESNWCRVEHDTEMIFEEECHVENPLPSNVEGEESFTWAALRQSMNIKIASLLVFKTFSSHGGLFKIMTRLYFLFYSAMFCVRFSATLSGWEGAMFYAQTISWPLSSVSLFQRRCEDVWEWSNGEWNCVWGK